ncbi:hypothetical protein HF984_05320 [Rothia terrae]|uniref:sensor histidine kinase n=1 Tax=Rothia terrae TaxID=396015 RepID=UPI001444EB5B|nr:ATP-binding protein [Rothia terrae]NKZ34190.1 hypothetical protein [Rothia terrae]
MTTHTDVTKDLARSLNSQRGNRKNFIGPITFELFCRIEVLYAVLALVIVVQMAATSGGYAAWFNVVGLVMVVHATLLMFYGLRKSFSPSLMRPASILTTAAYLLWPLALSPGESPYSWIWALALYGMLTPLTLYSAVGLVLHIVGFAGLYTASLVVAHLLTDTPLQGDLMSLYLGYLIGSCVLLAGFIGLIIDSAHDADTLYNETLGAQLRMYRTRDLSNQLQEFDKLVHDNVMATLLDASRQQGPLAERTKRLAERALGVLDEESAKTQFELPLTFQGLTEQVAEGVSPWNSRLRFNDIEVRQAYPPADAESVLPSPAARAFVHAVTEAVSNSARHSGTRTTHINLLTEYRRPFRESRSAEPRSFIICTVTDRGAGFQMKDIDIRRMGVRVSMMHSMKEAGGEVRIESAPGRGTKVTVQWPGEE